MLFRQGIATPIYTYVPYSLRQSIRELVFLLLGLPSYLIMNEQVFPHPPHPPPTRRRHGYVASEHPPRPMHFKSKWRASQIRVLNSFWTNCTNLLVYNPVILSKMVYVKLRNDRVLHELQLEELLLDELFLDELGRIFLKS